MRNFNRVDRKSWTLVLGGLLLALLANTANAAPIVTMQLVGLPGQPAIYTFLVDGVLLQTLCDDAQHSIGIVPYQATENTLSDLTGTLLDRNDDPNELFDYETIAILDLRALSDPTLIPEVEDDEWAITQNRTGRLDTADAALLSWAQSQNLANYDLSDFVIFATPDHQEQTGFIPPVEQQSSNTPELATGLLTVSGLGLLLLLRKV
jgi:hypothetical protein